MIWALLLGLVLVGTAIGLDPWTAAGVLALTAVFAIVTR